jgi:hypothetical protein
MRYFLAYNVEIGVFHYGELPDGSKVESGQPNLEFFESLNDLQVKLKKLGQTWVDPNN